jgi:hypothetical protein
MPATKQPVAKRSGSAAAGPLQRVTNPLAVAAPTEAPKKTWRAGMRSGRLVTAETRAPVTNPSCTAMVSQAASVDDSAQIVRSCGGTADAENHVVIDRTMAVASSASARRPQPATGRRSWPGGSSWGIRSEAVGGLDRAGGGQVGGGAALALPAPRLGQGCQDVQPGGHTPAVLEARTQLGRGHRWPSRTESVRWAPMSPRGLPATVGARRPAGVARPA